MWLPTIYELRKRYFSHMEHGSNLISLGEFGFFIAIEGLVYSSQGPKSFIIFSNF